MSKETRVAKKTLAKAEAETAQASADLSRAVAADNAAKKAEAESRKAEAESTSSLAPTPLVPLTVRLIAQCVFFLRRRLIYKRSRPSSTVLHTVQTA